MNVDLDNLTPIQLMVYTDRLHKSALEQRVNKKGLHRSQQMVLIYLLGCEKPISQAEIAAHFQISPAAIAVTLKKLAASGWIERRPCPGNARMNEITLSAKSYAVVEETGLVLSELDECTFAGISEAEQKAFTQTLLKMQDNIKKYFPDTTAVEPPVFRQKHNKIK